MKRPTEDQVMGTLEIHEKVGQSDMTLGELITSYRQAPRKNLQLHALAELTLLSEERIKELLLANGVRPEDLPKKRAPRKPKEQPEAKTQTTPPKNSEAVDTPPDPNLVTTAHIISEVRATADRFVQAAEALGQIIAAQAEVIRMADSAVQSMAELLKGGPHE